MCLSSTQASWPFIVFIYMMLSATAERMENLNVLLLCKLTKVHFLLCDFSGISSSLATSLKTALAKQAV